MNRKKRSNQEGFTFIEIMVAMVILLILISAAGFAYFRYVSRARLVAARNQIETISIALGSYFLDCDLYPTADQGLDALWEKPTLEPVPKKWTGPYLDKKLPLDPWGNEYEYRSPGPHGLPYGIRSFGADGIEGGDGNNQDIVSWES